MRHQFLLASVSAIALTGSAFAADLAPPPPPPVPIFTWTGAYIGGQIGYAWASGANRFNGVDPYSGVAFVSSVGQTPSGAIGGANLGYNYQINHWVIGVEGSVDGTSLSNTGGLAFPDGTILAVHSSTDVQGSIRGRVGIAWDRALIFATGGVAFGGFNTRYNYDGFGAAVGAAHLAPFFASSNLSDTHVGWTVGGGVQYAITNDWSVRADYRYTDWGSINEVLFGGTKFPTHFSNFFGYDGNRRVQQNQVQVGFDYKFDLWNVRPVAADPAVPQPAQDVTVTDPISDYFLHWMDRANEAQATQPHWMTPITTVTARLEQEFRYDQYQEFLQNGSEINNYFAGKGLELIPTVSNEILINVPPDQARLSEGSKVTPATGFGDGNFVTIKQRILSANEENGNYILTAFLGAQAPTGITAFTNRPAWIVTPTLAGGWGIGDFDVQGTIGYTLPTDERNHIGNTLLTSMTAQFHFLEYFWPEFGFNDTQWTSGTRAGRNQLLASVGIMFGRFQIQDRVKFNFGIAYQDAVVPDHAITSPLTPLYNHAWILSARMTF